MPIGLYSSILKPFIIPLGFTVTATICLLMTLKKCMRGYVLCRQLSCQNFSFYFVLNLGTGPYIHISLRTLIKVYSIQISFYFILKISISGWLYNISSICFIPSVHKYDYPVSNQYGTS